MYTHKKILVIDDEPQNLALANQALKDKYAMVFAKSGEEGIKAFETHKPDLVVLDISMPGMDGFEVCKRIKRFKHAEATPVIFLTSKDSVEHEERALIAGGDDFIRKPLQSRILRLRIKNYLSLISIKRLEQSQQDAIGMLSEAGHYNDNDTGSHIWRMAAYAAKLAELSGLPPTTVELIRLAAPLHDTGKIGIPDHILKKPGKLDEDEWVIMKQHSDIGYQILAKSQSDVFKAAADIAKYHHEKWDGSGYPENLSGEAIPLFARIVAIADVFDALTTERPYKKAWSVQEAFEYIRSEAGRHFDPMLAETFCYHEQVIRNIKATYP